MVLHVVMYKPKPGTTNQEIETALKHVKELQPKIPGLLEVRTGANLSNPDSYGHAYGFIMRFSDEAHMRTTL